jgi:threonyl-tRNA synthetase
MIQITLPDGKQVKHPRGTTPLEVAHSISPGLARAVISARYNNRKVEVNTPLTEDGELVLYTWNDEEGKKAFWHSSSHVVAQALEELYPGIKLTIGPAIDAGFYYDVDFGEHSISEKDFPAIEKRPSKLPGESTISKCGRSPKTMPWPIIASRRIRTSSS